MTPRTRLAPIDWLRGLVMALMTIDHASGAFNAGRLFTDGARLYRAGTPLDTAQFLTRWVTHLCAPTFVFLAGTSIALMAAARRARGESEGSIDRGLVIRGLVILALDPLWMTLGFFGAYGPFLFQVLYALGASMVASALLRRLPPVAQAVLGLALIVGADAVLSPTFAQSTTGSLAEFIRSGGKPGWLTSFTAPWIFLLGGGPAQPVVVAYPLASWLGIMLLGLALGGRLVNKPDVPPTRALLIAGLASLALFAVLRGLDGFGNMGLHRDDGSLVQWLHVSKYPPSVTFCALELGLMALLLAGFFALGRDRAPAWLEPLRVLGSTALFFYLLHAHLLEGAATLLGLHHKAGLGATYLSTLICLAALYAPCVWYARYKAAHQNWFTRIV